MFAGRQPDWRHTGQRLRSRGRDSGIRQILLWRNHVRSRDIPADDGSSGTGLRSGWFHRGRHYPRKWTYLSIGAASFALFFLVACGPKRSSNPQHVYDRIQTLVRLGDLPLAQKEAHQAQHKFERDGPEWICKFRVLESWTLLLQGKSDEALALLRQPLPAA